MNRTGTSPWRQLILVAVPKGLGGVLTVLINGVLLGHLGPAEYGVYAVCLLMVALADGVLGSAVDMSVVKLASHHRLTDGRHADRIEQVGVLLKVALLVVAVLLILALGEPLSQALLHRTDRSLLLMAVSTACLVLLMRSAFLHLQVRERFGAYAGLETLAQALRVGGVMAVIWWWAPSARTLTLAALVCTVIAAACGAWLMRGVWSSRQPARDPARPGPSVTMFQATVELWATLRWVLATFAFSALLTRVDILLLTQWSSMDQVGLYAAGQVFAQIPELLGSYMAVVFSPKVIPAANRGELMPMMRQVQGLLLGAALAVAAVAALAVNFGAGLLPAAYLQSGQITLLLMAGTSAAMCAFPVVIPYVMFSRPTFIFKLDLLSLPFLLIAYHLAIHQSGAIGAAWVTGLARLGKLLILQVCAWAWARQDAPIASAAS